jgi:sugar phosphate isomerase/epimerase
MPLNQSIRKQSQPIRSTVLTSSPCTRREFIHSCTGLVLAAGILDHPATSHGASQPGHWTVACRDAHLKTMGQPSCWAALKELGATGVEVSVNEELQCPVLFHPEKKYGVATDDGIRALKEDVAANGLKITALCMNNRLDEQLEREIQWTKGLVAVAQQLAVNAIRIDVVPRAVKPAEFMTFAIKACKQLCDLAKDTPVRFGIENHGNWTNKPENLEGLFDGVGSNQLGLTLDAMNFYWFGHPLKDLDRIFEKFAPRTFHTHCKNLSYPPDKQNSARPMGWEYEKHAAPLYEGDIKYERLIKILGRANYSGDLCLENECLGRFPKEQHADILKREIAWLKKLSAA